MQPPRPTIIKAHPYGNRLKRLPLQISSRQYVTISAILQLINSCPCTFTQSDDLSPLCSNACSITFQYDDCVGEIANSISTHFVRVILDNLEMQDVGLGLFILFLQAFQFTLRITDTPEIRLCLFRVVQGQASSSSCASSCRPSSFVRFPKYADRKNRLTSLHTASASLLVGDPRSLFFAAR